MDTSTELSMLSYLSSDQLCFGDESYDASANTNTNAYDELTAAVFSSGDYGGDLASAIDALSSSEASSSPLSSPYSDNGYYGYSSDFGCQSPVAAASVVEAVVPQEQQQQQQPVALTYQAAPAVLETCKDNTLANGAGQNYLEASTGSCYFMASPAAASAIMDNKPVVVLNSSSSGSTSKIISTSANNVGGSTSNSTSTTSASLKSDNFANGAAQAYAASGALVELFQKKRGNGGVWQPIEAAERIRVDKNKGKLIKLVVREANSNVVNWGDDSTFDIQLLLVDAAHPEIPAAKENEGFLVKPPSRSAKAEPTFSGKEFKLKLTKICKSQVFCACVTTKSGYSLRGRSIEFRSDDNGKVHANKKRKRTAETTGLPSNLQSPPAQPQHPNVNMVELLQQAGAVAALLANANPPKASQSEFANMIASSIVRELLRQVGFNGNGAANSSPAVNDDSSCASSVASAVAAAAVAATGAAGHFDAARHSPADFQKLCHLFPAGSFAQQSVMPAANKAGPCPIKCEAI